MKYFRAENCDCMFQIISEFVENVTTFNTFIKFDLITVDQIFSGFTELSYL